jgi:hypothetical protein
MRRAVNRCRRRRCVKERTLTFIRRQAKQPLLYLGRGGMLPCSHVSCHLTSVTLGKDLADGLAMPL